MTEKSEKSESALREEAILEFWQKNEIFKKTVNKKENPKGDYIFYDGPPTANGMPGLHHVEPQSFKDIIPRYKTMQGFHVPRKAGWDTHGLPVELQVEKELGLKSKKDIEKYGVELFNQKCKESVWKYKEEWMKMRKRMGYWTDMDNAYITYANNYIESLWGVVAKANERGFLYKDFKVLPWCTRCGTALSSHELSQPGAYKDVKDLSVYVKFKIIGFPDAYFLAWTTTPWTLPGNVALAVGAEIEYVEIKIGGEILVLAKERLSIIEGEYEIIATHKGSEMVGMQYEPLFPYLNTLVKDDEKIKNAFKVYVADFVNITDGTGIVHTAVMYGADDFELGTKIGLPKFHTVNEEGKFVAGTDFLEGRYVKEIDENGKPTLAVDIIDDLTKRGLLFKKENYMHSYPHCWRCDTPLIYYARTSWYFRMSALREQLLDGNKQINWEPEHIKDGRFGEWLDGIKDWAISRDRYWGTPLPVWQKKDGSYKVISSLIDLKKYTVKSGNKYIVMRHGESESNIKNNMHGVVSSRMENVDHLTEQGREQVQKSANKLKEKNIDLIFVSPFLRTRETVQIIKENLGLKDEQIIFDNRLVELNAGDFEGKPWDEYRNMFKNEKERFLNPIHGGESLFDVKNRMMNVLSELEEKYKNKNILIISHGSPLWMIFAGSQGYGVDECINMTGGVFRHAEELEKGSVADFSHFLNAEFRELEFVLFPHNKNYELDFHKPYIDGMVLEDEGEQMVRVNEVMDVWFDSGAMPYAQDHILGEAMNFAPAKADYISEAIDQTRGWFYTLHAVANLLSDKPNFAYKNVICLGHILDEKGQKMSKSKGNVVDPWAMFEKYGADTIRLWMYSVNQPGESKNFDEKTVMELHRQFFGLLYNVLAFYELYRDKDIEKFSVHDFKPTNILDKWILSQFDILIGGVTIDLDSYKLLEPVRSIRDFIGDLSTWYLRRSRDRIKEGDKEAKQTLYFVLKNLSKLIAPFAPFSAEDIWLKLKNENEEQSVHLCNWSKTGKYNSPEIIQNMRTVREIVSLALKERQKAGIPVRQPLNELKVKNLKLSIEYLEIIKDELNVKEVVENTKLENEVELDLNITPELKQEGDYREFLRSVQDMRKKENLLPSDVVKINVYEKHKEILNLFLADFKKSAGIGDIIFTKDDKIEFTK